VGCTSEAEKEKDKPNCLLKVECFEKVKFRRSITWHALLEGCGRRDEGYI